MMAPLWGGNVAFCFIGGAMARKLVSEGAAAMVAYGKAQVARFFGADALKYFQDSLTTNWLNEPWTLGSYTYATPGHTAARIQLATPLAGRIFFGGEACSVQNFQTVNGGYLAGIAAANNPLAALGKVSAKTAA
jgi:monoamine oxidase